LACQIQIQIDLGGSYIQRLTKERSRFIQHTTLGLA
jgi:hypothetical protein